MGLLSRAAGRLAERMGRRTYQLPLGDGVTANMTIHRAKDWAAPLPPEWLTRNPIGARITNMTRPTVDEINWGFGWDQQAAINKLEPEARARIGLQAMREVMDAIARDARQNAPQRYRFRGQTATHRKLYGSLASRAEAMGYAPSSDGHNAFLTRQFTPMSESVSRDAALDALMYGGAGAGLLGMANADR